MLELNKIYNEDYIGTNEVTELSIQDESKIINMYIVENFTLRHISELCNTNHHRIRRILVRNGVTITRRKTRKEFTLEHRRKISEATKGRQGTWKGKKATEFMRRTNMVNHMKFNVTLEEISVFSDCEKLIFLTRELSRNLKYVKTKDDYLAYINKFYFDSQFNTLYDRWIINKNKWNQPTLDHKTSKSKGGIWILDNLQFLTWFENRAKAEMSQEEWNEFKRSTKTNSDLFYT